MVEIRKPFTLKRVSVTETEPSMTEQSHAKACDVNNIMKKYIKTGVLDHAKAYSGYYADVPQIDFHEAQNVIAKAEQVFMEIPAQVRRRFDNDPGKFLDFIHDPASRKEAIELGFIASTDTANSVDKEVPATTPAG